MGVVKVLSASRNSVGGTTMDAASGIFAPVKPFLTFFRIAGGFPIAVDKSGGAVRKPSSVLSLVLYVLLIVAMAVAINWLQALGGVNFLVYNVAMAEAGLGATEQFTFSITWIPHFLSSVVYHVAFRKVAPRLAETAEAFAALQRRVSLNAGEGGSYN